MQTKKVHSPKIQIGTSSLSLIFTVLCLVVFCTLSLASAKADYRLVSRYEKSVKSYYAADSKGENLKREINRQLIQLSTQAVNQENFNDLVKENFKEAFNENNNSISYTIDTGFGQLLLIELQLYNLEQIKAEKLNFKITSWVIQNKVEYEVDNTMPVWNGI